MTDTMDVEKRSELLERIMSELSKSVTDEGVLESKNLTPACDNNDLMTLTFEGETYSMDSLLTTPGSDKSGIHRISADEYPLLLILSQLCYNCLEIAEEAGESPFVITRETARAENVKLIWDAGRAVGFYTFKEKGARVWGDDDVRYASGTSYVMPMLETLYVRKSHRGRGLGTAGVLDFLESQTGVDADADVGVLMPVSEGLWAVLTRLLTAEPRHRDNVWAATWTGDEGYRSNVWLDVRRRARKRRQEEGVGGQQQQPAADVRDDVSKLQQVEAGQ